ncbi:hypothetical protein A3Q56_03050 [Intoshia linei]|uniref:hydroxymethylglutaryl-CoA lyase n=1 Tax=Intoshia linei TaxID=1819745 RepID=A0A177B4I1_9BILA|nr:hypothetical protein A3Q56_03050 [Intoshia linei]
MLINRNLQLLRNLQSLGSYKKIKLPKHVNIMEVSPRDGLQNEKKILTPESKIDFINMLTNAGIKSIEVGSFVSKKWVPQMADSKNVFTCINKKPDVNYFCLTPNQTGLETAMECNVKNISVFSTASETFCRENINTSIIKNMKNLERIIKTALDNKINVRGYVSCIVNCPYEGFIEPKKVAQISKLLLDMGCSQVALGDTIGSATPNKITNLLNQHLELGIDISKMAAHFHNTFGQGIVNAFVALSYGINTFDGSVAGLGGCPYAPGASGNLPTEDLIYMLHGMGIETEIDIKKLALCGQFICQKLGRSNASNASQALYCQ